MPSYFNWLANWQRSVGVTIYNARISPFTPRWVLGEASLARQFQNTAYSWAPGGRSIHYNDGISHVRVESLVGGGRPVVAVHPAALPIDTSVLSGDWPALLKPDPRDPQTAWVGNAPAGDKSVRVASLFVDVNSIDTISTFSGRYSIGQFSANNPLDRAGAILCGTVSGTQIVPPWLYASVSELSSPRNLYSGVAYYANHASDETVLPWSALLEIDYREDANTRTRLASVIVLAHGPFQGGYYYSSVGDMHVAITSNDSGEQCAISLCTTLPLWGSSQGNPTLPQPHIQPIVISANLTPNQISRHHAASVMYSANTPEPLASCSGITNTQYPALRRRAGAMDWGATVRMPLVSATSVTPDEKNRSFQRPNVAMPFLSEVNGIGSAISPLAPREQYSLRAEIPFQKKDVGGSPLLAIDNISYVVQQCYLDSSPSRLLSPQGAEVPVLYESQQNAFVCGGKTISGCSVEFIPWTSPGTGEVNSWGRNCTGLVPHDTFTSRGTSIVWRDSASPIPPDQSGVWWKAAGGMTEQLAVVEQQSVGVIQYTATRLYNTRTFLPMSRSGVFTGTYQRDAAWDEHGYLAGKVANVMTSSGHFATASEQTPPVNIGANNPPSAITNKYPSSNTIKSGYPGYFPSLAGHTFQCTAASEGGVPFSAGTFRYRGAGGSFNVSVQQEAQGRELWVEYDTPLPTLHPPVVGFNQMSVNAPLSGGERPYAITATHNMTFQTTFVDVFVQWFVALQGPGSVSQSEDLRSGIDPYDARGVVSCYHVVDDSVEAQVRPTLAARVFVRATGKILVESQYEFPEITGMSGTYPLRARMLNTPQGALDNVRETGSSHDATFFGRSTAIRRDGSYATWMDTQLDAKTVYFNADQTAALLDGQSVTPTLWYINNAGDPRADLPELLEWHDTFFAYKMAFSLDVA